MKSKKVESKRKNLQRKEGQYKSRKKEKTMNVIWKMKKTKKLHKSQKSGVDSRKSKARRECRQKREQCDRKEIKKSSQ